MKEYRSACYSALVKMEASKLSDFIGNKEPQEIVTSWFNCTGCGDHCDTYISDKEEKND